MDFNPPSTADFARADANNALNKIRDLENRVRQLEMKVDNLYNLAAQAIKAMEEARRNG